MLLASGGTGLENIGGGIPACRGLHCCREGGFDSGLCQSQPVLALQVAACTVSTEAGAHCNTCYACCNNLIMLVAQVQRWPQCTFKRMRTLCHSSLPEYLPVCCRKKRVKLPLLQHLKLRRGLRLLCHLPPCLRPMATPPGVRTTGVKHRQDLKSKHLPSSWKPRKSWLLLMSRRGSASRPFRLQQGSTSSIPLLHLITLAQSSFPHRTAYAFLLQARGAEARYTSQGAAARG